MHMVTTMIMAIGHVIMSVCCPRHPHWWHGWCHPTQVPTCDFSVVACLPQLLLLPLLLPRLLLLPLDLWLTLHASTRSLMRMLTFWWGQEIKCVKGAAKVAIFAPWMNILRLTLAAFLALIRSARLPCCPGLASASSSSCGIVPRPRASDRLAAKKCGIRACRDIIDPALRLVLSLALARDLAPTLPPPDLLQKKRIHVQCSRRKWSTLELVAEQLSYWA